MATNPAIAGHAGVAAPDGDVSDGFDLDVTLVEVADPADPVYRTTDDGCGSTCGACTTNVA